MPLPEPRVLHPREIAEIVRPWIANGYEYAEYKEINESLEAAFPLQAEPPIDPGLLYPGWVRVLIPVVGSTGLWTMIGWIVLNRG